MENEDVVGTASYIRDLTVIFSLLYFAENKPSGVVMYTYSTGGCVICSAINVTIDSTAHRLLGIFMSITWIKHCQYIETLCALYISVFHEPCRSIVQYDANHTCYMNA